MEKRKDVGEEGNDAKRMRMDGPKPPAAKVTFKTKKQREHLALQQKQEAEEADRLKAEKREAIRHEFLLSEELQREKERQLRMKERERARGRMEEERRGKEENAPRRQIEKRTAVGQHGGDGDRSEMRTRQQEAELAQIKEHYLGTRRAEKKVQKPSERFRNTFSDKWDLSEDTNRNDSNPIYQERREPQLLFGRGLRAGIDVREQRRQSNFYDELSKRRARQSGEHIFKEESRNMYRADKKREEMNDRDWKIFREEQGIIIRGGRVPAPMRTWAESLLPYRLQEPYSHSNASNSNRIGDARPGWDC
uniref:PRP28/DDX23-like helical domain-containing protein n=1 Tax=Vitrella brassicaformis TaxID=1169539 RepID=A0A7S1P358_9ALVE